VRHDKYPKGAVSINPLSDYVGSVNQILSALQPALGEERHLALDEEVLLQPKARS
jgi:hypothetical protein